MTIEIIFVCRKNYLEIIHIAIIINFILVLCDIV